MPENNAAQSLLDLRSKLGDYARKALGGGGGSPSSTNDTSWHDSMVKAANKSFADANAGTNQTAKGNAPTPPQGRHAAKPNTFKHGGVVQKTGIALVHKGETVIPVADHDSKEETVHLSKHRVVMHLHAGGLHRALNVPEGQTIPKERIEAATHSKNPHLREMAHLALTMEHWHHK